MSSPVSTSSPDIDLFEAGNPWTPNLGFSCMDAAGVWCYIPDQTNHPDQNTRIVRVHVTSYAQEDWLPHAGGLPPGITGLCFSQDFLTLYATAGNSSTHLWAIDVGTKVVADLGDNGNNLDALYPLTIPGEFVGLHQNSKNLFHLAIAGASVVVTPDYLVSNGWTSEISLANDGSIYRAYQKSGPGTDGPIFHYVGGKFPMTRFDAGYLHNSGTIADGPAFSAKFAAESLAVMGDKSVLYFCQSFNLKAIFGGNVIPIGSSARKILAVAQALGRLVTCGYSLVNVWY